MDRTDKWPKRPKSILKGTRLISQIVLLKNKWINKVQIDCNGDIFSHVLEVYWWSLYT